MNPKFAEDVLKAGGYLLRRDERLTAKKCPKMTTRLYDKDGNDLGVANYARKRLIMLCKIKEITKDKWVLK